MLLPTREVKTAASAWNSDQELIATHSSNRVTLTPLILAVYIQQKEHEIISLEEAIEEYKQPRARERRFAPYALQD